MINFLKEMSLPMTTKEAKLLNPQALAFVGDSVHTLFVRSSMVTTFAVKPNDLHKMASNYIKASGQSDTVEKMLPLLTEEETDIFKRARNYKTKMQAKNAEVLDYKRATGYEAVIGYLYLTHSFDRLKTMLELSIATKSE